EITMALSPAKPTCETDEAQPAAEVLEADLARLRQQVERDDVLGACAYVQELQQRWPDSPRVQRWTRVLAPAEVTLLTDHPTRPLEREQEWIRQHRGEHPGCWIAVHGDRLI